MAYVICRMSYGMAWYIRIVTGGMRRCNADSEGGWLVDDVLVGR